MATRTIQLSSGAILTVTLSNDTVTISTDEDCEILLLREKAWQLAEALDDITTRSLEVDG